MSQPKVTYTVFEKFVYKVLVDRFWTFINYDIIYYIITKKEKERKSEIKKVFIKKQKETYGN